MLPLVAQTDLALPELPPEAVRLYPDSDRAIDSQREQTERCAASRPPRPTALVLHDVRSSPEEKHRWCTPKSMCVGGEGHSAPRATSQR